MDQQVTNPTNIYEGVGSIPGSLALLSGCDPKKQKKKPNNKQRLPLNSHPPRAYEEDLVWK